MKDLISDQQLEKAIEQWSTKNIDQVSINNPISNHLDEILGIKIPRYETIATSCRAFGYLAELIKKTQHRVKPTLVIRLLTISANLGMNVPYSWEAIEDQLTHEPPSLYLLDWEIVKGYTVREEFSSPLPFQLMEEIPDKIYVYYKEFRSAEDIENNWEVARGIYIEYFPNGLIG